MSYPVPARLFCKVLALSGDFGGPISKVGLNEALSAELDTLSKDKLQGEMPAIFAGGAATGRADVPAFRQLKDHVLPLEATV